MEEPVQVEEVKKGPSKLQIEVEELRQTVINRVQILESDYHNVVISVEGPEDTAYYGGNFKFKITAPEDYP